MDQDDTWHEVSLGSGHIVLDRDPAPLSRNGGTTPKFTSDVDETGYPSAFGRTEIQRIISEQCQVHAGEQEDNARP